MAESIANGRVEDLRTYVSALVSRLRLGDNDRFTTYNGARDPVEVLGYRRGLGYRDYLQRYLRQDIAATIVKMYPEDTWSQGVQIKEAVRGKEDTPFEAEWKALERRLGLSSIFERADILNNLGSYSLLLLGLAGQPNLALPAAPVRSSDDLLYVMPYSEEWCQILAFDDNAASASFGRPVTYRIDFHRQSYGAKVGSVVHASRVVHIAEDCLDNEIYGIPRLQQIYDRLDDLLKVVGGSAEMFWRDAKRRLALSLHENAQLSAESAANLTEELEEFMHGMRDFLRLQNMDVTNLAGSISDPRGHVEVLLDLIAAASRIPKRRLLGSERGELASTQDENAWYQRIMRRQRRFAEPRVVRPFIDKCLSLNVLPPLLGGAADYLLEWPNLLSLAPDQQATIASTAAAAMNAYTAGFAQTLVPPEVFLERYLGLDPGILEMVPDMQPDVATGEM